VNLLLELKMIMRF